MISPPDVLTRVAAWLRAVAHLLHLPCLHVDVAHRQGVQRDGGVSQHLVWVGEWWGWGAGGVADSGCAGRGGARGGGGGGEGGGGGRGGRTARKQLKSSRSLPIPWP